MLRVFKSFRRIFAFAFFLITVALLASPAGSLAFQKGNPLPAEAGGTQAAGAYDALVVGVPDEDIRDIKNAGGFQVIAGEAGGLTAIGNFFWSQDTDSIKGDAEAEDRFGAAMVSGDFDGDGNPDLAVGIPDEDVGSKADAGAVQVFYHDASALSEYGDQLWMQGTDDVQGRAEADDRFGSAVTVGDFNGDGYDDLAIGVPNEDVTRENVDYANAGVVHILYGSDAGLTAEGNRLFSQNSGAIVGVAETGDRFGSALASGDFNHDGYDDLAIGVHGEDVGSIADAGAVQVLYGSINGVTRAGNQLWTQDSTGISGKPEVGDQFGRALAAADFDRDGYDDLAIGVPGEALGDIADAGGVQVLYGSDQGVQADDSQFWSQKNSDIAGAAEQGDRFGAALSGGDFSGDGYADLAIGIPGEDVNGAKDAGGVLAIYGSAGGLKVAGNHIWNQFWSQDSQGVSGGAEAGDQFGFALASGDFDDDGRDDLAIGIPYEAVEDVVEAGAVQVLYGTTDGLASDGNQFWSQRTPDVVGGAEAGDHFGLALAVLDYEIPPPTHEGDYQCFPPVADTFVDSSQPSVNFGAEDALKVFLLDSGARGYAYLRFDLSAISGDALILSAVLKLHQTVPGVSATFYLRRATAPWQQNSLTWANQSAPAGNFDDPVLDGKAGLHSWNAIQPVSDWVLGNANNWGFIITSSLQPQTEFASREGINPPELCVEWTRQGDADLETTGLEVTQSVQDLNNSVPLIVGKRTFVRLHARSLGANARPYRVFAQLAVQCDGFGKILHPINENAGNIIVKPIPDRAALEDAFLFELPSSCTDEVEAITIEGFVNPQTGWRGNYPPETSASNNLISTTVTFEMAPPLDTVVYLADYQVGNTAYRTSVNDASMLHSWLQRAYPIANINMTLRRIDWGQATVNSGGDITYPDSTDFNADLSVLRLYERMMGRIDSDVRYYGMIDDGGGFMRGAGAEVLGVAAGPTGSGTFGWDTDGSYGDWYGGHELGHTLDRAHALCQGDEAGPDSNYPHPGGLISDPHAGDATMMGFDSNGNAGPYGYRVYGPWWSDVMSYCNNLWISDYTYVALKDYLQNLALVTGQATSLARSDQYLISGRISGDGAQLAPVFLVPDAPEEPLTPGDYAIVLLDAAGQTLARHTFAPDQPEYGPPQPGEPAIGNPGSILTLLIPAHPNTAQIVLQGPDGSVLASIAPGPGAPAVQIVSPNGGEAFPAGDVTVRWAASDPDGDPLTANIFFSPDNGATWRPVVMGASGSEVIVPRENLIGSVQARFQVQVSDGLHTAADQSDGAFRLDSLAPTLEILSPQPDTIVARNQTLSLQARAYSERSGFMDEAVQWLLDDQTLLGQGETLAVTELPLGVHRITAVANDGVLQTTASVTITVVRDPSQLPVPGSRLHPGVSQVVFRPQQGLNAVTISLNNAVGTNPLRWQVVQQDIPGWLSFSKTVGSTPDEITFQLVDAEALPPGEYATQVTFHSPDATGSSYVSVTVSFSIPTPTYRLYLPQARR